MRLKSGASKRKQVHISYKTPAALLIEVRVDDKGKKTNYAQGTNVI
jgi:hypothetical protein